MTTPATCFPFGRCRESWGGMEGERRERQREKVEGFGELKDGQLQGKGVNEAWLSTESSPMCHQLNRSAVRTHQLCNTFKEQLRNRSMSPPSPKPESFVSDISSWHTFSIKGLEPWQPVDVSLQNHMKGQTEYIWIWPRMLTWINKSMVVQSPGELHP